MPIPVSELQKINPSSIIELFKIELVEELHYEKNNPSNIDTIVRFHAGTNKLDNTDIIWQGNTYQKFPCQAEGFEFDGSSGSIPRPTFTISNILGTITALFATVNAVTANNDLNGAKFTRIRTLARYLDAANFTGGTNPFGTPDTTQELPQEIYFIDRKVVENREVVQFELASELDLINLQLPKRVVTRDLFPGVGTFINQ